MSGGDFCRGVASRKQLSRTSERSKTRKNASVFSSMGGFTVESTPGRLRPSELNKATVVDANDYPMIVDNVLSSTSFGDLANSTVNPAVPLFQPSPTVIIFQHYAPYAVHERKIFFRNNDVIARRFKIVQPDSPFFEVSAAKTPSAEPLKASKVAAGIGICYTIRFKPKDVRDYSWDLVCCTERETFIVPIRALGTAPKISFPDQIDFGPSTVGLESRKLVLLRNNGSAVAKFTMSALDSEFSCPLEEQTLEPGAATTVEVFFTPREGRRYSSDFRVELANGMSCFIALAGSGVNVDVSVSLTHVSLEPTYISLRSQKTLRILNRSDAPINFKWKSFRCLADEDRERQRLVQELQRMEELESLPFRRTVEEPDSESTSLRSSGELVAQEAPFELVAAQAELVRKYRNLRRALESDSLLFVDSIFEVSPQEGQVWAASELEITVSFRPDTACLFEGVAYLEVSGREDRLWLGLAGEGVGAYATLSFDVLDIGDVFVNNEYLYQVTIRNKGDIPAAWAHIPPDSVIGSKFHLSPKDGLLGVGQTKVVSIRFECDVLGDFAEMLRFSLQGNEDPIACKVKGSVIGPTLHFDCLKIDYGIVSFDYLHQTTVRLVNASSISTVFSLLIPKDGDDAKKEFDINPAEGTLGPGEFVEVTVDLIPSAARVFEYALQVDVLGVGEALLSIPLLAECVLGGLRLLQKELAYGDSFIRYAYDRVLTLENTSDAVHTKFEILPQLQYTTSIALYSPETTVGFIAPGQSVDVKVQLVAQKIGSFKIALAIAVSASKDPPQQIALSCVSVGPKLSVDKSEVRWGNVNCLTDHVKSLTVKNESLIVAPIKMFAKLARSKFMLSEIERVLQPMESFQLDVTCNLDDSIPHKDELYIVVEEGEHIMVPLTANGVGTTMFCLETLDNIDLGVHLTNVTFEKKFFLENRGRRPQQLHWYNKTVKDLNTARLGVAKKTSKDSGLKLPKNLMPVEPKFTIEPSTVTLRPHTATTFVIKGLSANAGKLLETFVLESVIGKERAAKDIITTNVVCEVVNPLVEFSEKEIDFLYSWTKGEDAKPIAKNVTITNRSDLNLNIVLKAETPFNLSSFEHLLAPGQNADITVDFYPMYRDDRVFHSVSTLLSVAYRGHPQRDSVPMKAEILFPNLGFDRKSVDFGCVLNDSLKSVIVRVTNTSKLDANFEWTVLEPPTSKTNKVAKGRIFDILPFRSFLRPGEAQDVRFTMIGAPDQRVAATAVCSVEGGPEYKIPLSGEASAVSYSLEAAHVDFGSVVYSESSERYFCITNTGKVPFPFVFLYSELSSAGIIEATPSSGKVNPGEKFRVNMKFFPVMPCTSSEALVVKIAHFDPFKLKCFCKAIFSSVYLNLPRYKKLGPYNEAGDALLTQTRWEKIYEEANANLQKESELSGGAFERLSIGVQPRSSTADEPTFASEGALEDIQIGAFNDIASKSPALSVDVEVQRLSFCNALSGILFSDGGLLEQFALEKNIESYVSKSVNIEAIACASYILDFGNVIVGQTKKRSFRITNATATGLISWAFQYRYLGGSGFSIDPEKVSKLPELASVDMLVRFTARKTLGRKEVLLPLERKNAPTINIVLVATVCLPEINFSSEAINFDRVKVGNSQRVYVKLTNASHVKASWSLNKSGKDEGKFIVEPAKGVLLGGKTTVVSIEFCPNDNRKFACDVSLCIETNPKQKLLKLVGDGSWSVLQIKPAAVEIGPVLPFSKAAEKIITIENTGDYPVELISLNFDRAYLLEEESVRAFDGFDKDGIFRWDMSGSAPFSLDAVISAAAVTTEESLLGGTVDSLASAEKFSDAPIRTSDAPRDKHMHLDYLVVGERLDGVSTLARALAGHLHLPVRSVDEVVSEVAKTRGVHGLAARRVLGISTEREISELAAQEEELVASSEESIRAAVEAYKKTPKGKGKDKDIPPEVLLTAQALALESFLKNRSMNEDLLVSLLDHRLSWEDTGFGFVLDGIVSKLCSAKQVVSALSRCLKRVAVVQLDLAGGAHAYETKLRLLGQTVDAEEDGLKRALERSFNLAGVSSSKLAKKKGSAKKSAGIDEAFMRKVEVPPLDTIPFSEPVGDEPWLDIETGSITELDVLDFRSLEHEQRPAYLSQFRYQCKTRLIGIRDTQLRLREIVEYDQRNLEENPEKQAALDSQHHLVGFDSFSNELFPLIASLFTASSDNAVATSLLQVPHAAEDDSLAVFNAVLDDLPLSGVPAPDPDAIPDPQCFKLTRRPPTRSMLPALKYFEIVPLGSPTEVDVQAPGTKGKGSDKTVKGAMKGKGFESTAAIVEAAPESRWIIPPNESLSIKIRFNCKKEGSFNEHLRFEVVGTKQELIVPCFGVCDIPKINDDPRNLFMKRVKSLAASMHPSRRFVLSDNLYSFGPLLVYKKAERRGIEASLPAYSSNFDLVRLTNAGKYPAVVELSVDESADESSKGVFVLDTSLVSLEEGESKDVKLWAFPTSAKSFSSTLVACIQNNPAPVVFDLRCVGVVPVVEFDGPWADSYEQLQISIDACKDKKLLKDLELKLSALKEYMCLDFDRILVAKSDLRSFTVRNTSLLGVAWELDKGDFRDSSVVSFSKVQGHLDAGGSCVVTVTFESPDVAILAGKFNIKYSDLDQGLLVPARVKTCQFKILAEAYSVQTVTLNADGQELTANEIDFGTVRVGDVVMQTIKIANNGKYKIGFQFAFKKASFATLLKVEPDNGLIEAGGTAAEVKLTFCCADKELVLSNCRDLRLRISEPVTSQIVEEFPLSISAVTKFNKFRMLPLKGVSFGAVRYDAQVTSKRVEIRNEGDFEFTYVVCSASTATEKFADMDRAAFACYAFNTPAALRARHLGANYLERLGNANQGAVKSKKETKPPPTKKDQKSKVSLVDLDQLAQESPPEDALKMGAFSVSSRVGVVAPGQSAAFDISYDPTATSVSRGKLKVCITGLDYSDSTAQCLESFDVNGESCFPSIVTNDVASIFEEQEIVPSLLSTAENGSGDSKFEKVGTGKVVYAEQEKTLVFGPIMCNQAGSKGAIERIRITNPTKIDVRAKFRVESAVVTTDKKVAKDTKKGAEVSPVPNAFSVSPAFWDIPPHEHRFVNVHFNPSEIRVFKSRFVAEVVSGETDSASAASLKQKLPSGERGNDLIFNLAGAGTLPSIAIDFPVSRNPDGTLALEFQRGHVGRRREKSFTLRNSGVLPVTCLFEMTGDVNLFSFPYKGASASIAPGKTENVVVAFLPKVSDGSRDFTAQIKITVQNNQFDQYVLRLKGTSYSCDAVFDTLAEVSSDSDSIVFAEINLTDGAGSSSKMVHLRSTANHTIRYELSVKGPYEDVISVKPSCGHLIAQSFQELQLTFSASSPVSLADVPLMCTLSRILVTDADGDFENWNNSMKSLRPATGEDLKKIEEAALALKDFLDKASKQKKGKVSGRPPSASNLLLMPRDSDDSPQMVCETVAEPKFDILPSSSESELSLSCSAVADFAKYSCEGNDTNIPFVPTFMFQSSMHKFSLKNECNLHLPVSWYFEEFRRRGMTRYNTAPNTSRATSRQITAGTVLGITSSSPNPFSIEPAEVLLSPNSSQEFCIRFLPLEVEDFVYVLKGQTLPVTESGALPLLTEDGSQEGDAQRSSIRMVVRGTAKRPVCHFEMKESVDYLVRRLPSMTNELGLVSPIQVEVKVAEVESIGLRSRNTYRFSVLNPTNENYEFLWESVGVPSPFWRCVYSSGMLFSGKRVEMVFEYLPESVCVAEAFFKFRLANSQLEQLFLFAGSVTEPKVFFSQAKLNFQSVVLGGEGGTETLYLQNEDYIPFNFAFDKSTLAQLEGPSGPVVDIHPLAGVVPPYGRVPIAVTFKPQEEMQYNFNMVCEVKRKPSKLSLNVKGEGYAVHAVIQLEMGDDASTGADNLKDSRFGYLKPAPAVNALDFGTVQLRESTSKKMIVTNTGKFNFDYAWDTDFVGSLINISGNRLGGTLKKGEEISFDIAFAPQREEEISSALLKFVVAGKYTYRILPRGVGVLPALRFSCMNYDFGPCFVTSPGGSLVTEEMLLRLVNHDAFSSITVECLFQKTLSLWVECPPTVIAAGATVSVPIRFAPRENKDYVYLIPFLVNGSTRVSVSISGRGVPAKVELVNAGQHRVNFGVVNVGADVTKVVPLINRSSKPIVVQLVEDESSKGVLTGKCVSVSHVSEFTINPRSSVNIAVVFSPSRRIPLFAEDVFIRYAGTSRKLLTVAGRAQGADVLLETDSMPFGTVVESSQKTKKLRLENNGDIPVSFRWNVASFGPHFSIVPASGKLSNGSDVQFDVVFKPQFIDSDIRQDRITLEIFGVTTISLTCSGVCVAQPTDSIQTLNFQSPVRGTEKKEIRVTNPSDKDWFVSPAVRGVHWSVPHELKVPAKGSADLVVNYFPLYQAAKPAVESGSDSAHIGSIFIALPDGNALLYNMRGYASAPLSSGHIQISAVAKKPHLFNCLLNNWLGEQQKFQVDIELQEKPSPAVFVVAANVVEIPPHGSKEFPLRFNSYVEGTSRGRITFTNAASGEYLFFEFTAQVVGVEVQDTLAMDSPLRQSARRTLTLENPLGLSAPVTIGSGSGADDWWSCDSKAIRVKQLSPFAGNSEGSFEIEYRPYLTPPSSSAHESTLKISSKELGDFKIRLLLTALQPTSRPTLRFEVPFGSVQTEVLSFQVFNKAKCEYTCSISQSNNVFFVQKSLSMEATSNWEGETARLNISFDPSEIGEKRDILKVSHADGGTYEFNLVAVCTAPVPQGPFTVQSGATVSIPFRNCFTSSLAWTFSVDSTNFKLLSTTATVAAKAEGSCAVVFEPKGDAVSSTAKLFITCGANPPWVYYLKGVIDPSKSKGALK